VHTLGKKGGIDLSSVNSARRRAEQIRRSRGRRSSKGGEDRGLACLVICGIIFVLLVGLKLLFPETAARLAGTARQMISQDADFEEAFAAVGRMVSGEAPAADALQDAYIAVFNPAPQPEPEPQPDASAPGSAPARPVNMAAGALADKRLLRFTELTLPEAEKTVMKEMVLSPGGEGVDLTGPAASQSAGAEPAAEAGDEINAPENVEANGVTESASYAYMMASPPENASLELRNLGFDHCTPVQGTLSSTFGWREHPIEGGNKFHYGVDLAADTGTDIIAFADGEVYATGESSSLGNYIMLRHEGGYITLYGHCSRVTATGGAVSKGDKIAEVGSTGLATGPHLHFELHDGDLYLNPIYYVEVG